MRHPSRKNQQIALFARGGDRRRDVVLKRSTFMCLGWGELQDHAQLQVVIVTLEIGMQAY